MRKEFELNIIKCLKYNTSGSWIKLLQEPITKTYYFMGNGGQGTSIISEMKPQFIKIIKELIESNYLIIDKDYYSIEHRKSFTLYKFQG
jgi:hypothetical protein